MARKTNDLQSIRSEGGLFPADLLRRIADPKGELPGTKPVDYGLAPGERLNDAITASYNKLARHWADFRKAAELLPADNPGMALTNEKWTLPLLRELGFGFLQTTAGPRVDGKDFPISRFHGATPIHLLGCGTDLDKRSAGQRGAASGNPHGLVQEFLNRSEDCLWGIVSNGLRLRILRDNQALSRQSYLEFDLEALFTSEAYADFVLLWMTAHATRFTVPETGQVEDCLLERWTREAEEQGTRALTDLRTGVQQALICLGQGLVGHPKNTRLREALRTGTLSKEHLHAQLLRVVYRLIFLFVAEDRHLEGRPVLHAVDDSEAAQQARDRYARFYGMGRLRELADRIKGSRHSDLWEQLNLVMGALSGEERFHPLREQLALPALGSLLWDPAATEALNARSIAGEAGGTALSNADLLDAVRHLAFIEQNGQRRPVDYRNLGSEELGGVYEGLLALLPQVSGDGWRFSFAEFADNERRNTGSYYTPDSLVQCVLDATVDPLLAERLQGKSGAEAELAILAIKVCDPAVGSGHFLVGAAHRLAKYLARVRAAAAGESEPSPRVYQHALRDVIGHCLYGVDVNPMSAELCRVNLWLEALEPGKPLSFLDHHIRVGNSLLGATPELVAAGIPDGAFKAVEGDDAEACKRLNALNKAERRGMGHLFKELDTAAQKALQEAAMAFEDLPDDRPEDIKVKERALRLHESTDAYKRKKALYDAWCAAFFLPKVMKPVGHEKVPVGLTQKHVNELAEGGALPAELAVEVGKLVKHYRFFHWHLAYPEVFAQGGFDILLGNPPWERIELQEREFFAHRAPDIAKARNAAARKELIAQLETTDPALADEYRLAKRLPKVEVIFHKESGKYPFGAARKVNVYAVFADLFRQITNPIGAAGLILPNGLVTGYTYKDFLGHLIETQTLGVFYGFENEDFVFKEVHHSTKFGILVMTGVERKVEKPRMTAHIRQPWQVHEPDYVYTLSADEIRLVNPNTLNLPACRYSADVPVLLAIHRAAPALILSDGSRALSNPWGARLESLFNMATDSNLFVNHADIADRIDTRSGTLAILDDGTELYPLYEGKMCWHFDHRYGTYEGQTEAQARQGVLPHVNDERHNDSHYRIEPRYWLPKEEVDKQSSAYLKRDWFFIWRKIGPIERTLVGTVIPKSATGDSTLMLVSSLPAEAVAAMIATISSLVADFDIRQSANQINLFVMEQLAVLTPQQVQQVQPWLGGAAQPWLAQRVLELCYTNVELEPFARDLGFTGPPFRWQPARRALLQAEIDAAVMHLYQLTRAQAEWILDSFTVLRKYEESDHGEFRTKRQVLEIYDAMEEAKASGAVYQSRLEPGAGDVACCHTLDGSAVTVAASVSTPKVSPASVSPSAQAATPSPLPRPAAGLDAAATILAHLRATPGLHGKSAILAATGIDESHWNAAIKQLVEEGKVRKEGEKKGARYGVEEGSSVQPPPPPQAPLTDRYSDAELAEFRVYVNQKLDLARQELQMIMSQLAARDADALHDDGNDGDADEQLKLLQRQEKYIKHLEEALLRIRNKTYGICRVTGRLISKVRLREAPHATMSIEGKRQMGA
jgi:RNA polymerase-binding transcription factor DksA